MQVEDGRGGGLGRQQLAGVDAVDDGARVAQLDATAHAVAPARPPAQQQPKKNLSALCMQNRTKTAQTLQSRQRDRHSGRLRTRC